LTFIVSRATRWLQESVAKWQWAQATAEAGMGLGGVGADSPTIQVAK